MNTFWLEKEVPYAGKRSALMLEKEVPYAGKRSALSRDTADHFNNSYNGWEES